MEQIPVFQNKKHTYLFFASWSELVHPCLKTASQQTALPCFPLYGVGVRDPERLEKRPCQVEMHVSNNELNRRCGVECPELDEGFREGRAAAPASSVSLMSHRSYYRPRGFGMRLTEPTLK